MKTDTVTKLVLNGLMIALVFLATYFTSIPTPLPTGYFNFGDAVIMITAIILGKRSGLIAGALGSFLADIAYGAFIFAPITLVVKGIEGYLVGRICELGDNKKPFDPIRLISVVIGAFTMIAGYFISEVYILSIFDEKFGLVAALSELAPNTLQGGLSAVIGLLVSSLLIKANIRKYIPK